LNGIISDGNERYFIESISKNQNEKETIIYREQDIISKDFFLPFKFADQELFNSINDEISNQIESVEKQSIINSHKKRQNKAYIELQMVNDLSAFKLYGNELEDKVVSIVNIVVSCEKIEREKKLNNNKQTQTQTQTHTH